jgi:hypothetical protein
VFDREGEVAGEGGQVEREAGWDLAAIDEHLGPMADRGGNGADADIARSGWQHPFPAELGGPRTAEPDGAGFERELRAQRLPSGYSTRLSRTRSTP